MERKLHSGETIVSQDWGVDGITWVASGHISPLSEYFNFPIYLL